MVYPSNAELLKSLGELPLAGHVASALASPRSKDLCVVASALQLVHILVERLPALYVPLFKREGSFYKELKVNFQFSIYYFNFNLTLSVRLFF